jgi:hypothetical protein
LVTGRSRVRKSKVRGLLRRAQRALLTAAAAHRAQPCAVCDTGEVTASVADQACLQAEGEAETLALAYKGSIIGIEPLGAYPWASRRTWLIAEGGMVS